MSSFPYLTDLAAADRNAYFGSDPSKPQSGVVVCGSDALAAMALVDHLAGGGAQTGSRFFVGTLRRYFLSVYTASSGLSVDLFSGLSTADVAILIVDARNGVLPEIRQVAFAASLFGVKNIILAINTLDLAGYEKTSAKKIEADFQALADDLSFESVTAVPVAAVKGENVSSPSAEAAWRETPPLLAVLEAMQIDSPLNHKPFRMPARATEAEGKGTFGLIVSGVVKSGDKVKVLPSAQESVVDRITTPTGDVSEAGAGQFASLVLQGSIDVAPGETVCTAAQPCEISDQFRATVLWTSENELLPGRTYLMKIGEATAQATIAQPRHVIDIETMDELAARTLERNDIGVCHLNLDRQIAFDPFSENRETGRFTLLDRLTNEVVGAGIIDFALRRASNIHMQALDIDKGARSELKGQRPAILWFTGLSGSGKSTIANALEKKLHAMGRHTAILDGDNVRHGLNQDLGFTDADRVENIRRVSEVGKLMVEAGLIVLVSFISPFRSERKMARQMMDDGEFVEIHVDTPLEVAEQRDVKGLYAKARSGEIKNFTGIDSPYEAPLNPEIRLATTDQSPDAAADELLIFLKANGYIGG